MHECPTVETERLLLRPFRDDDLARYFAVHDTPEVRASLHIADDFGPEQAWGQMASHLGQWSLRNSGQWAVELKATGEFIGRAGTHRPERDDWPGLECGWTFDPAHWGHGYATEAGRATLEWAWANHDDDRICSVILPDNAASQGVASRLGFTPLEERVLAFFPSAPHGIWGLDRPD
ncbi:MAG: GNAT family N-acetyltransferase [Actinomycetota bacterium]